MSSAEPASGSPSCAKRLACMAATFGSPLAAVVLAIELLLFEFSARAFVPLVVATSVAAAVHASLYGNGPLFSVPDHDFAGLSQLPWFGLLGIGCGLLATLIARGLFAIEHLTGDLTAQQMAEQQHARVVRPLQVVEHEHDRPAAGDERHHTGDRLEQPVAARLRILGQRLAHGAETPPQGGDEAGQLVQLGLDLHRQHDPLAVGHEVLHGRDERLVGHERLGVGAAVEHRGLVAVDAAGNVFTAEAQLRGVTKYVKN